MTLIFVAVTLAAALARAQSASSTIELVSLSRQVDACTDFYQFACGGWQVAHPLHIDRQRFGRFQEVLDRNYTILRRILETPSAPAAGDDDLTKVRDDYAACMAQSDL